MQMNDAAVQVLPTAMGTVEQTIPQAATEEMPALMAQVQSGQIAKDKHHDSSKQTAICRGNRAANSGGNKQSSWQRSQWNRCQTPNLSL